MKCIGNDPLCPCQDGDACHYVDYPGSPAMPIPTTGDKPMDEQQVEKEIQDKGLDAPRVRPTDLDNEIETAQYHVFEGTTMTVCCLTLKNGFQVTGFSAAASPENFDEGIGRTIAHRNAREQIWGFLGFRLRDQLHEGSLSLGDIAELRKGPEGEY